MKPILLIAALFFFSTLSAQENNSGLENKERGLQQQNDAAYLNPGRYPFTKKPAPGTYKLRQDNMPCIVPDTKEIAAMPNAAHNIVPFLKGKMPNGSKPNVRIEYSSFKKR